MHGEEIIYEMYCSAVTGRITQRWWNKKTDDEDCHEDMMQTSSIATTDTVPLGSMEQSSFDGDDITAASNEDNLSCLDERIDYELQEGFTERKLGYASFTSHTSYWRNQDLACFVLTKLYGLDRLDEMI